MQVEELSPSQARQKVLALQWQLWRGQYEVGWVIPDLRPEQLLRNELTAYWEGRITTIHGWFVLCDIKDWIVEKITSLLRWLWDHLIKPGAELLLSGLVWIAEKAASLVSGIVEVVATPIRWIVEGISTVAGWIRDAVSRVWDFLCGVGSVVANALRSFFEWIWSGIQAIGAKVWEGITWVASHIADAVRAAWKAITSFIERLIGEIAGVFSWIWEGIKSLFRGIVDVFKGIARWIWDNVLVPLGRALWAGVETIFKGFATVLEGIVNGIVAVARAFAPTTPERGLDASAGIMRIASASVIGLVSMTLVGELCHPLKNLGLGHVAAMLYDMSGYKLIIGAFMGALTFCLIKQPVTYHFQRIFRPILPDKRDIIEARSRGLLPDMDAKILMGYHGFSDDYYYIWEDFAKTPVRYFALRAVATGGFYDYELFEDDMRRTGYPPAVRQMLHRMYQSLAAFEVKGIYAGVALNRYRDGLIDVEQLHEELKMLRTPESLRQIYATAAELMRDAKLRSDVIAEVSRAYRQRKLSLQDAGRYLRELGIEDRRIQAWMLDERLVLPEDVYQTPEEELRAYGMNTSMRRYREGFDTDTDFIANLKLGGYTDAQIQRYLIFARLERDYDYCSDRIRAAHEAYAVGALDDKTFPAELATFMVDLDKINLEHEKAKCRRLPKVKQKVEAS